MAEYYGVQRSEEYLAHYGIRGMKWGVRRYLDTNGKLTSKGEARYGKKSTKKSSARKIQRDFNRLDESYANVVADKIDAFNSIARMANKHMTEAQKYQKKHPEVSQKKAIEITGSKYIEPMKKQAQIAKTADNNMKAIENLQWRTLAKASENKYNVETKPRVRFGQSKSDKRSSALLTAMMLGGGYYSTGKRMLGQEAKVRKKGDGKVSVVNYRNASQEEKIRYLNKY